MTIRTRFAGLALVAVLLLPEASHAALQVVSPEPSPPGTGTWIARGGGGRGGGGGGSRAGGGSIRGSGGGGGSRAGASHAGGDRMRAQTGFQGANSSLNRGERRPSGGWSNSVQAAGARPSLERPASREAGRVSARDGNVAGNRNLDRSPGREGGNGLSGSTGSRDLSRADLNRGVNRDFNRDVNRNVNRDVNRNWTRNVNIGDVDIHPGWARPGWGVARPWNTGWYGGWSNPPWGWWGARAAVWGVGTLATASLINSAVDAAINSQVNTIVVPNTTYQLLYGTVAPTGGSTVSFAVSADGSTYQLTADCQAGTINGQDPASAAEAELLNAACQVAFGSTGS